MKKHKNAQLFLTIFIGLIIIFMLIIGLFKLIESSRLENNDYKPDIQPNAVWKCTDPNIEFEVMDHGCFGKMKLDSETINLQIIFGRGMDTSIKMKNIHTDNIHQDKYNSTLVFWGDCKFYESKCVVKVTESNVDSIKVGDKIIFVKQES